MGSSIVVFRTALTAAANLFLFAVTVAAATIWPLLQCCLLLPLPVLHPRHCPLLLVLTRGARGWGWGDHTCCLKVPDQPATRNKQIIAVSSTTVVCRAVQPKLLDIPCLPSTLGTHLNSAALAQ
jgi:hypothetical protein